MGVAKLPLAKDIDEFAFDGRPINENLVRDLAGGGFVTQQRNVVLIGGTGRTRPTWRSPSPGPASGAACAAATSTSSTS